ncbi:MAG: hypothetical protein P8N51_14650, partial [Pseudomonadales bacterium]|nr:hypothetical protein [Pseudomonadales bacterium]
GALLVFNNSTLIINGGNTISTNGDEATALDIVQSSAVTKGLDSTTSDTISSTGLDGLGILIEGASSAFFITDSGVSITGGVEIIGGSYLLADAMDVTGGMSLELNSSVLTEGSCPSFPTSCSVNISGDVNLFKGSMYTGESAIFDVGTITISKNSEMGLEGSVLASDVTGSGTLVTNSTNVSGNIHCPSGDATELTTFLLDGSDTTGLTVSGGTSTSPSCVFEQGIGIRAYD